MKLPSKFPPLKEAPKGFRWADRGRGWTSNTSKTEIAFINAEIQNDEWEYYVNGATAGFDSYHYVELEAITRPSLEDQIDLAKEMVGKKYSWNGGREVTIKSWHVTNSPSHKNHGGLVVDEVLEFGVSVYLLTNENSQFPVLNKDLVEYVAPLYKEVRINASYSAKVYKDKIEVGCQTFDIDILEDLIKASREISEQ